MRISGRSKETFLFLNGLEVQRTIALNEYVELRPARWNADYGILNSVQDSDVEVAATSVFLPRVWSQLRIASGTAKETGKIAWNALWYTVLFSAFFDCEVVCNLQSDTAVEDLNENSKLQVTNYYFHGLRSSLHKLTEAEETWIADQVEPARILLENELYETAIHALATYRWHAVDRARLALLWAGLEGLFQIDAEVIFRLSLYVSRFLHPDDASQRRAVFAATKRLYKARSKAVHGGALRGDTKQLVAESAGLLRTLLYRCVAVNSLPDPDTLAP